MDFSNIDDTTLTDIIKLTIPRQPQEKYYGNREYKRKLIYSDKKKFSKRCTQMLFRLHEGDGKAIYLIGIEDNGDISGLSIDDLNLSLNNIIKIANNIDVQVKKVKIHVLDNGKYVLIVRLCKDLKNDLSIF